jgi:hypothetical protein
MRRNRWGVGIGVVLAMASITPTAAQGPAITEVVGGLNSPRGVAVGSDGTIYVAEAGMGGEDACLESPELGSICFGPTGSISAITDGTATRVVEGLTSGVTGQGEVLGASDVTVDDSGTLWFIIGGPGEGAAEARNAVPEPYGASQGLLFRVGDDGTPESVADFVAFESEDNPDAGQPANEVPDSNINSVAATADGAVVADAGGNDLLAVDADGNISVVAVFPVRMQEAPPMPGDPSAPAEEAPAEPQMVPMDPVPTAVAVGPDDAYYVGELTGFPFPVGGARVYRVVAGEEPTVYAEGFTNIMDIAFGPDGSLYVLEIAHEGLLAAFGAVMAAMEGGEAPPAIQGGLWKVPAGGGTPELVTSEGLIAPGGLAVGEDGTVYVSTCTLLCPPGAGGLVSLQP